MSAPCSTCVWVGGARGVVRRCGQAGIQYVFIVFALGPITLAPLVHFMIFLKHTMSSLRQCLKIKSIFWA